MGQKPGSQRYLQKIAGNYDEKNGCLMLFNVGNIPPSHNKIMIVNDN